MKLPHTLSLVVFISGCALTPAATASDCAALGPCVSIGNIAVMAENDIADPILKSAQDGAAAFSRYFGAETAPIAIVPGGTITPDMQAGLKQAGYSLSLPWISAADKQALAEASVRKQVMEQTKGMAAAQQEAIIKMAFAKAGGSGSTSGDMSTTEQGALTHELGHLWFIAAFKPKDGEAGGSHGYGGWAPDWLDETAAVLLENETLTASRRKAFKDMPIDDFYPLEDFLTMEHPALKSAQALKEKFGSKTAGGSRAIILTGEEGEAFLKAAGGSNPANFYTQARGFADYIIDATSNEQVFAGLARHLSGGDSLENWLANTEELPNNMAGLNEDWRTYLAKR